MPRRSLKVFRKRVHWRKKVKCTQNSSDSSSSVFDVPVATNLNTGRDTLSDAAATTPESASRRKLAGIEEEYKKLNAGTTIYEIINVSLLSDVLENSVCCKQCGKCGVSLKTNLHVGLACELELMCSYCKHSVIFFNSSHVTADTGKLYDINIRLVYGLRCIGKGRAAGAMLCGVMNLPAPPSKFNKHIIAVGSAVEDVAQENMKDAVEEAVFENNNNRDLSIAFDGSWQKRGHTSLNGVVTATSVDTGKVVDVAILSKHCRCKDKMKNKHEEECMANYYGSSGGMEVAGVRSIYQRSVKWYNVRYINYLGDGDSKAFKEIEELRPYGNNVNISKLECVGHVQKRMGSRLRRLKASMKGKKLRDGKTLDGKNRLTDATIDHIQKCYGLAIRQNTADAELMRRAVWALFFHTASNNENPQHGLCPKGDDSWCKYNRGKVTKQQYNHPHHLPPAIMDEIKPIFRDLADISLLKKCLHGRTQNPNECVNHVIWNRLPKTVFVGINTLHFGVYDAVSSFNQGNITKCKVLQKLGLCVGLRTGAAMLCLDKERLRSSDNAIKVYSKMARQHRRAIKRKLLDNSDDTSYGAGMH